MSRLKHTRNSEPTTLTPGDAYLTRLNKPALEIIDEITRPGTWLALRRQGRLVLELTLTLALTLTLTLALTLTLTLTLTL